MNTAEVETHFKNILQRPKISPCSPADLNIKFPSILRLTYDLYLVTFPGGAAWRFLLLEPKEEQPLPAMKRHLDLINELLAQAPSAPMTLPVFCLSWLSSRTKQRMIKYRIPFIVPQMASYIPSIYYMQVDIPRVEDFRNRKKISKWSSILVISELLNANINGLNGIEITKMLGTSPMTISRAINELEGVGLCRVQDKGHSKVIKFPNRNDLWKASEELLSSPIVSTEEIFADELPSGLPKSGLSALAELSLLTEPAAPFFAIDKSNYQEFKSKMLNFKSEQTKQFTLEIWNRDPLQFTRNGVIDPISLYLTLNNEQDERIQNALDKLLKATLPEKN